MSSSRALRSSLQQTNNSTCASKLYESTNKSTTNRTHKVSHKKDTSIGTHEAFCDISFDVLPGKLMEEVHKIFNQLKLRLNWQMNNPLSQNTAKYCNALTNDAFLFRSLCWLNMNLCLHSAPYYPSSSLALNLKEQVLHKI